MKRFFSGFLSLLLALILGLGSMASALAGPEDYSLSEKLLKQLEAGNGFTGQLSFSLIPTEGRESEAVQTTQPFVFDISYITVLPDLTTGTLGESRYDIRYLDGESTRASALLSQRDGQFYLKTDLLNDSWYMLGNGGRSGDTADAPDDSAPASPMAESLQGLLSQGAMPSLYGFFLSALSQGKNPDPVAFSEALTPYTTKIDLWIEGYRQSAVLGKTEDGTSTMKVDYTIPPSAVKAQLKQLVMDMLMDGDLHPQLQALLPKEDAALFLSPAMQSFYFAAIDALPLEGDMTLSRTVSLKGATLALHLNLPLYDKEAGSVELSYDRTAGKGDLPEENVLSLLTENVTLTLEYQVYSSMTDVTVYQGTLLREPHRGDATMAAAEIPLLSKALSTAFTLTHKQSNATDAEGRETLSDDYQLTLEPLFSLPGEDGEPVALTDAQKEGYVDFPAFTLQLQTAFSSKAAKGAATSVNMSLTLSSEELPQRLEATFTGKSAPKWTLEALDLKDAVDLMALTNAELAALEAQGALKVGACFLPYLKLPTGQAAPATSADPAAVDTAPPAASTAPTDSLAPAASTAPADSPAPTDSPSSAASTVPMDSPASEASAAPMDSLAPEASQLPEESPAP